MDSSSSVYKDIFEKSLPFTLIKLFVSSSVLIGWVIPVVFIFADIGSIPP